jgi:hypothetical protein
VEVRLGAVARVPTPTHSDAEPDQLPGLHLKAAPLQVRQQHERATGADGDHHVVTGQAGGTLLGSARLSQRVRHQGDLGATGLVVGLAVVREDNRARRGSQDRASEPDEDLRWLGGDEPSPGPRGRTSVLIHRNEVDRV